MDAISLKYTTEQRALSEQFHSNHESRPYVRLACPACCPGSRAEGRKICGWERGTCGELGAYSCTNCGFIETYNLRQRALGLVRSKPSAGQQRVIDRIKSFFSERSIDKGQLKEFEVKAGSHGDWWVSVRTTGNCYVQSGGFFHVGNRGSLECSMIYDLITDKAQIESTKRHYEKMIKPRW